MGTVTVSNVPVGAILECNYGDGVERHEVIAPTGTSKATAERYGWIVAVPEGEALNDSNYLYIGQDEFDDGECTLVSVPDQAPDATWNRALIELAIEFQREVVFGYAKGNDGSYIETRRLTPDALHTARNGTQSVVGYDPDRQDVRAYRLDRIKGDVSA